MILCKIFHIDIKSLFHIPHMVFYANFEGRMFAGHIDKQFLHNAPQPLPSRRKRESLTDVL